VPDHDVEYTETILYHVQILEELGEVSEGLDLLDASIESKAIVEHTTVLEFRGTIP
jgi:N-alpha-acetyltransferase 15/16, NatA auxiliary subunit